MSLRDFLRIAVLRTNPYPPFTALNRIPYALAIKIFVRLCRRFPEIKSVYLRHSLDNRQWTPALSDIDLTVILHAGLSLGAEFSFLRSFWRRIDRVKGWFPMLGEIEILDETHLASRARFGIEGRGVPDWLLLHGTEIPVETHPSDPVRFSLETFDYAFWFYLSHFTQLYVQQDAPRYLVTQDLLRLLRKIEKCMAALGGGEAAPSMGPRGLEQDELALLRALDKLERGLGRVAATGDPDPAEERRRRWLLRQIRRDEPTERVLDIDELSRWAGEIQSIYLDQRGSAFVILRNFEASPRNQRCIEEVRNCFQSRELLPVILTRGLFVHVLRYLDPSRYFHMVRNGTLIFGTDILAGIRPPDPCAMVHHLIEQAPLLLMFPRSRDFIQPGSPQEAWRHEVCSTLERALALKLVLERGIRRRRFSDMLEKCHAVYPRQGVELRRLKDDPDGIGQEEWSWRSFVLLRDIVDDVHRGLSASGILESMASGGLDGSDWFGRLATSLRD